MNPVVFQNILVAIDESDVSQAAFEKALMLAKALGSKLLLVHVVSTADNASGQIFHDRPESEWRDYAAHHEARLQQKVLDAENAGVTASYVQTHGIAGAAICYIALKHNINLLVVGTHRRHGLSTLTAGSTSCYVNRHAHCPVLMVHSTTETETAHQQTAHQPNEALISVG
ncbi:MAG: universal stress protein [Phormidesmis sp.]